MEDPFDSHSKVVHVDVARVKNEHVLTTRILHQSVNIISTWRVRIDERHGGNELKGKQSVDIQLSINAAECTMPSSMSNQVIQMNRKNIKPANEKRKNVMNKTSTKKQLGELATSYISELQKLRCDVPNSFLTLPTLAMT